MKKTGISKIINWILGLLLIFVFAVGAFYLLKFIVITIKAGLIWLVSTAEKVDAVVIVASISAAVSITTLVIAKVTEYRQITKRYLYNKKEEPYTSFIEMVYKIQRNTKGQEGYSSSEMIDDITKFSKGLTLWGSNKVVRKWIKFRTSSQQPNANPNENVFILEDIIFEIRKDMGHKGKLRKGDLLRFFVNDVDSALAQVKKK